MSNVTSYEIKEALARKHGNREFFMTEVKNGPTGVQDGALLQFDGVAIYKSWTRPCIRGYEIKVSRSAHCPWTYQHGIERSPSYELTQKQN